MAACVFCRIVRGELPCSPVYEDEALLAFLDVRPWRPGHALVVPRAHVVRLDELGEDALARLVSLGRRVARALRESELACHDVHLLVNDGPAANQSVPHAHLHVIPRRRGDLWLLLLSLARLPLAALLPPAPRARLDRQAALVRARLERAG